MSKPKRRGRPPVDNPKIRLSIRLPSDLYDQLNTLADANDTTLTEIVERALILHIGYREAS